ncbi:MAG: signal recognition particle receptor subunit alpha, partial [Pygmaiobacter massiliensis]
MGFFEKLSAGLAKTRNAIFGNIGEMENADRIDDEMYEELLEQLVLADTGIDVVEELVDKLKAEVKKNRLKTGVEALEALKGLITEMMTPETPFAPAGKPAVILVIGVNGVGKTTSIAKIANLYK